jgi:sugar phosphate isomerase/epimerase
MTRRDILHALPAVMAGQAARGQAQKTAGPQTALKPEVRDKTRLRPAICAYSFRDQLKERSMSYADLVRLAVDLDVDGLDLTVYWFPSTLDEILPPLRGLAYRMGVNLYSISIRTEMTKASRSEQDAEVASIKKWVDAAQILGAGHIRVFGGNVPNGATTEQAAGWTTEVLKRASEYSGSKGIILGLENHGGITERADTIVKIVKAVNSPWVGINLDTGNFRSDVYEQIEECAPFAVNVQVKAEMRGPDGHKTQGDWERVAQILTKAHYKGYLALEYEAEEDAGRAVPRLMKRLRQVCDKHSSKASN